MPLNSLLTSAKESVAPSEPGADVDVETSSNKLASELYEILGAAAHVRCNFSSALSYYQKALTLYPANFQCGLKLASISIELGDLQQVYDKSMHKISMC